MDQLLKGIAFVPTLVNAIEGLFGDKPGTEKKDAAMAFLQNALAAMGTREIVDPEKFRSGLGLVVDGVVVCLNSSSWAKENPQASNR